VLTPEHLVEANAAQAAEALAKITVTPSDDHKTHQSVGAGHDIASVLGSSGQDDHGGFAALIHAANNPQQLPPHLATAAHELQAAALSHVAWGAGSIFGQTSDLLPLPPAGHGETHLDLSPQHASPLPPALNETHHIDLPIVEPLHALHH
jgi:hypothetical protein